MGQFDDAVKCPKCGTWGAKKSLWKVKCVNPACAKYDSEYGEGYRQSRISGKTAIEIFPQLKGNAEPNDYTLQIRYHNFQGNEIIYSADPRTAYRQNQFVVVRLAPTGKRVSFRLDRIQNRSDVESVLSDSPQPDGKERRILHYHSRRGTSSPAFEKLREKYPNYQA
ncbi:MAG TPA: hypothetical protein VMI32_12090 [Candidatus Solibacter sp.]|nr:hypothetical protein [Candidatus Solibacter sp.]